MAPTVLVVPVRDGFVDACVALERDTGVTLVTCAPHVECTPLADAAVVVAADAEPEALKVVSRLRRRMSRVALVGSCDDYKVAIAAIKSGAETYIVLPRDFAELRIWLDAIAEESQTRNARKSLAEKHRAQYDFSKIMGSSRALHEALRAAGHVIQHTNVNVLITGETGTGKELLAHAIHYNGPRVDRAFLEINCAALPSSLLEAELFGYERGAFTDARDMKPGIFEVANGGTVFLDEIGEMSPELQTKLLRAIDSQRIRRLGSTSEKHLDIRFIAATNADLRSAINTGRFRSDLFFRLSTVRIDLPPLRARGDDVVQIAEVLLNEMSSRYSLPRPRLSAAAKRRMLEYHWPGNIRELKNLLERAVVMEFSDVEPSDIGSELEAAAAGKSAIDQFGSLDEMVRAAVLEMLERVGGNKSAAAARLNISRKRLYSILSDEETRNGARPQP